MRKGTTNYSYTEKYEVTFCSFLLSKEQKDLKEKLENKKRKNFCRATETKPRQTQNKPNQQNLQPGQSRLSAHLSLWIKKIK